MRGAKRRDNPFSCGSAERNAVLFGKFGKAADSPKVQLICYVSLRGRGLPHLVAPKSAMPCSGQRPEQGNAPLWLLPPQRVPLCGAPQALARNDIQKEGRVRGCKDVSPLSLRGAERRGNPHPLRQYMAESSTLGEYAATTNLPEVVPSCQVSLRGKRIATPVCALARNDMQKEGRVSGCKDVSPLSLRGAKRRDNPRTRRAA